MGRAAFPVAVITEQDEDAGAIVTDGPFIRDQPNATPVVAAAAEVRSVVIIQARATSTRLPDKVALDLAGRTVLDHVVHRASAIPGADAVCVAVPEGTKQDHVADLGRAAGAHVVRGSENDVLARYAQAAAGLGADVVIRITSDCPLVDPATAGHVLDLVRRGGADYATNNIPPTWPHGLDCEAFTRKVLDDAARSTTDSYDREHVTPWMRRNEDLRRVNLLGPGGELVKHRWTLDVLDDLLMLRALFSHLPQWPSIPDLAEVLEVLDHHPEIVTINAAHRGESRPVFPGVERQGD